MPLKTLTREELLAAYEAGERDFSCSYLSFLDLTHLDMQRSVDFSYCCLEGTNFTGSTLTYADFTGSDLSGAEFKGCDLREATFDRTLLQSTDFPGANLVCASFRSARFAGGVDFTGAKLPHTSHEVVSYLLWCTSHGSVQRLMVAGLLLACPAWCWYEFYRALKPILTPEDQQWVRDTLAPYSTLKVELALYENRFAKKLVLAEEAPTTEDIPF